VWCLPHCESTFDWWRPNSLTSLCSGQSHIGFVTTIDHLKLSRVHSIYPMTALLVFNHDEAVCVLSHFHSAARSRVYMDSQAVSGEFDAINSACWKEAIEVRISNIFIGALAAKEFRSSIEL